MTPEQLEAHRVRFERQYASLSGESCTQEIVAKCRAGDSYTSSHIHTCWQAYQWALADADRAQRAAPGVQASYPSSAREVIEMLIACHEEPTCPAIDVARQFLCDTAQQTTPATQPPQQSAQPVADAHIYEYCQDDKGGVAGQCWNTAEVTFRGSYIQGRKAGDKFPLYATPQPVEVQPVAQTQIEKLLLGQVRALQDLILIQNRRAERADCLEKSAQPVEVQRVPTIDQIENAAYFLAGAFDYPWDHMPEHGRENMRKHVRMVMDALGIKPTSSEGGAAC